MTTEVKASHILVQTQEEALNLLNEIKNGNSFAELASQYSLCPSGYNGGDLGYFAKGTMVDEFENAVVKLENGKYSTEPVKSSFGYHIILKVAQKDKPKLKEVKDEVIDTLVTNKLNNDATLRYKALYEVRKEAGLEIHDDEIKKQYENYMDSLMKQ